MECQCYTQQYLFFHEFLRHLFNAHCKKYCFYQCVLSNILSPHGTLFNGYGIDKGVKWWQTVARNSQWANGGGGLQSPTSQHGGHQNRRTMQGLVYCFIIITHSHKCTHRSIWVGGIVCQKIAIYKALILSHGHFVFSVGGGGLFFKTTHEVKDSAYEVKDSLGGGGLCTYQRNHVLKWKQLLFALHLY